MLVGAVLAFASALVYGVSDYSAAVSTRRLGLVAATTATYVVATVAAGAGLLVVGGAWSWPAAGWSAAAAVATIGGLLAFYAAMAIGPMTLVSPLIALLEAAVPVVVGAVLGERFAWLGWVAVGLALVAGILMSISPDADRGRLGPRTLGLSLVAGAGLGASVVLLDRVPEGAGLVPAFVDVAGGLVVLAVLVVATWRTTGPALAGMRGRGLAVPLTAGVCLAGANVLLVLALQRGDLAVVGVLVSLYALSTIALARLLDHERPSAAQLAGIGAALVASALFALG